jgi:recombination protein RecA
MFGTGISRDGEILDIATELGVIDRAGTWFAYQNERLGQGRENAKDYLRDHPETRAKIESVVYENLGFKAPKDVVAKLALPPGAASALPPAAKTSTAAATAASAAGRSGASASPAQDPRPSKEKEKEKDGKVARA